MQLKCLSFNVAGMKDQWFERRLPTLVRAAAALEPDVILVQETTICRQSEIYDQASDLGEKLGLPFSCFSPYGNLAEVMGPEYGGIAIASRWPLKKVRSARLPTGHDIPPDARTVLYATIMTPESEVDLVNVHLSWRPDERELRVIQLSTAFENLLGTSWKLRDHPTLIMGDFNGIDSEPVIHLANTHFKDAFRSFNPADPGHTFVIENPYIASEYRKESRRLDYIFCPKTAQINEARVVFDTPETYASDHLGLFADLSL